MIILGLTYSQAAELKDILESWENLTDGSDLSSMLINCIEEKLNNEIS